MKDYNLRFFKENRWHDGMGNLLKDDLKIPKTQGAYILGTDGENLIYPWGRSPVFYIGQSSNLAKRLADHKKYTEKAIYDHDEQYWWPRYQYGASFGVTVAWYSVRGTQNPNTLEASLIDHFYDFYGAIPTANGAWPSGLRPKHGTRDDR